MGVAARVAAISVVLLVVGACTTTTQQATEGFTPPAGNFRMIVMRPNVEVSVLTAGGQLERREDWTEKSRELLFHALEAQQAARGGTAAVARTNRDAGADEKLVTEMNRLHGAVGQAIRLHKYTPGFQLPTKKTTFDWTLGESAIEYGRASGNDYALMLYASDSFSSGGRVALQAMSMLGCVVGVCVMPGGGTQIAFASLVDLRTGRVVWFNYLVSTVGDIREEKGAQAMVEQLLGKMHSPKKKSPTA